MSRQIEMALLSLMPSFGKDLPPSLVELAGSLLAQSRNLASTLKAEEDIARLYACANIACDRLKISLDLPPIEPRPPVPPRIYKRLYSHLDNVLPTTAGKTRRSSARTPTRVTKFSAEKTAADSSSRPLPSRRTPTKDQVLNQFRKNTSTTPRKLSRGADRENGRMSLPPWVAPVIRFFCAEVGCKKLAPTILAGAQSVLSPSGRIIEEDWTTERTTEVLAAILYHVTVRFRAITTDETLDDGSFALIRKEIVEVLNKARKEAVFNGAREAGAWDGWTNVKAKEFDAMVEATKNADWLDSDWFRAVTEIAQNIHESSLHTKRVGDGAKEAGGRRADTMFQDRYDFLSESRKADYKIWKRVQMAKMKKLGSNAMEIEIH